MEPKVDLIEKIKQHSGELLEISTGLAHRDKAKVAAGVTSLLVAAAGHPELAGLLSPFVHAGVQRAFVNTATTRLISAAAKYEQIDEQNAFISRIAESIEVLIGQSLIQLVRTQHQTKDAVVDALGGLRTDLQQFRSDFEQRVAESDIRIEIQRVLDGATGIRVSADALATLWIGEQFVSGQGSVGIYVGSR